MHMLYTFWWYVYCWWHPMYTWSFRALKSTMLLPYPNMGKTHSSVAPQRWSVDLHQNDARYVNFLQLYRALKSTLLVQDQNIERLHLLNEKYNDGIHIKHRIDNNSLFRYIHFNRNIYLHLDLWFQGTCELSEYYNKLWLKSAKSQWWWKYNVVYPCTT